MTKKKRELDTGLRIGGLTIDPVTGDLITTGNIIVASPGQLIGAGLGASSNTETVTGNASVASMPLIKIPAATLSYAISGNTIVGTSSNTAVTINNLGTGNLIISNAAISGTNASEFSVTGCSGDITANSSCSLVVRFTPAAASTRTSTVSLTHNGPDSPTVIQISAVSVLAPIFTVSPSSLDFGNVDIFTTKPLTLTVTNAGSANLNISSLIVSGANATNFSASGCTSAVQPGGSCAITVNFRPTINTTRTASLTIAHNGFTSPATIPLTGVGTGTITPLGDWTYRGSLSPLASAGLGAAETPVTLWSSERHEFFVAGPGGTAVSSDGATWVTSSDLLTKVPKPKGGVWAAELNSYFVFGLDFNNRGRAARSSDGITWTALTLGLTDLGYFTNFFRKVAWSGSRMIAGIFTTTDGWQTWENFNPSVPGAPSNVSWSTVRRQGSKFIIGGGASASGVIAGHLAESTDGVTWTNKTPIRASDNSKYPNYLTEAIWNGSQYLFGRAYDRNDIGRVAISSDGATWEYTGLSAFSGPRSAVWAAERNEYIVGLYGDYLYSSTDGGATWTKLTLPGWTTTYDFIDNIIWNGSKYLVTNSVGRASTSTDGTNWTYQSGLAGGTAWGVTNVNAIIWTGSQYLAVGDSGRVGISYNGSSWGHSSGLAATLWGTSNVYAVNWNGTQFLVAGADGKTATSATGAYWTNRTGLSSTAWGATQATAIVWNNIQYLIAGQSGKIATSPDGITWTYRSGLSTTAWGSTNVTAAVWNGSQYLIVGDGGKVATSTDGITWAYRSGLISTAWGTTNIRAVNWSGTQYLVVGASGKAATSPDGITWTYQPGLSSTNWGTAQANTVVWNSARYVVAGAGGNVATSFDGIIWEHQPGLAATGWGSTEVLAMVQTGTKENSKYVVAGVGGKIATNELVM